MATWTHVGNVGKFVCTPGPVTKEHFTSMGGTKELDKIAVTEKKMTFEMDLDEWNVDNLVMASLGLVSTNTAGADIEIMGASQVERQVKFTGSNDFGPRVEIILPNVFLLCTNPFDLIGDDWMPLKITGSILRLDPPTGIFGTIVFLSGATGSAPVTSPDTFNYYIGKGNVYTSPLD